jgi:hypothetical protein
MDFSDALIRIKDGKKLRRKGWNSPNQYVFLFDARVVNMYLPQQVHSSLVNSFIEHFVVIKTVQGNLVPWLVSQTDLLAEDWEVTSG